jgi:hypothetical protein
MPEIKLINLYKGKEFLTYRCFNGNVSNICDTAKGYKCVLPLFLMTYSNSHRYLGLYVFLYVVQSKSSLCKSRHEHKKLLLRHELRHELSYLTPTLVSIDSKHCAQSVHINLEATT